MTIKSFTHTPPHKHRDDMIDFMRMCGLVMIILAHTSPHKIIMQLRTFDVPWMVIVSALSFSISSSKFCNFFEYLWHRSKQLMIPVWIFLLGYFSFLNFFIPTSPDLKFNTILETFLLFDGMGYVWIIRVFLLIALLSPLIKNFEEKETNNTIYLAKLLFCYALYEASLFLIKPWFDYQIIRYITYFTHYAAPYGLIFAFGLRLPKLSVREITGVFTICFCLFILYASLIIIQQGKFVSMWYFKYPPSGYYVFYAIAASSIFWLCMPKLLQAFKKIPFSSNLIRFISSNSMWIYLWHIPLVEFLVLPNEIFFFIVLIAATTITFIQHYLIAWIKNIVFVENGFVTHYKKINITK